MGREYVREQDGGMGWLTVWAVESDCVDLNPSSAVYGLSGLGQTA